MDLILKYFPDLSYQQIQRFEKLRELYSYWNSQINVISRKDMDHFYERHVLHSLGIAKAYSFTPDDKVLDIGTGGGFPGIPLAILFPETHFHLVDSIGKKVKVVDEVAQALDLKNVKGEHIRAEQIKEKYNFIVSRAVTHFERFLPWTKGKFSPNIKGRKGLKNGILYLKGGDLSQELSGVKGFELFELKNYFSEAFFETKKVVYYEHY